MVGACNIIALYAIRGVLFVSLSATIPIISDWGKLNEMVVRKITGAVYNTEEMIDLTPVIVFLSYFDNIRC